MMAFATQPAATASARNQSGELPATIPALLDWRVRQTATATALTWRITPSGKRESMTWAELSATVMRLTTALRSLGVLPGDRVAVLARTCIEWHLLEHAALHCGAILVGIDTHSSDSHLDRILSAIRPRILVADESIEQFTPRKFQHIDCIVQLNGLRLAQSDAKTVDWKDICFHESDCDADLLSAVSPEDPATWIYTSGTTGDPKAIEYTHSQLTLACQAICNAFPILRTGDTTICWLPMAHLFQRMMNLVSIAQGANTVFVADPKSIGDQVRDADPAVLVGVPRFFEKMRTGIESRIANLPARKQRIVHRALKTAQRMRFSLESGQSIGIGLRIEHWLLESVVLRRIREALGKNLRYMITGSAPLARTHLEFFADIGWPVYEAYGVSECAVPIAANRPGHWHRGSVGIPFPENRLRLSNDGEVLVRGAGVFKGYLNETDNSDRFTPDGYFRTGDLGRFDSDGYLYLLGRQSEMFKTSTGRKVLPSAIESTYQQLPLIDQIVVFGAGRPYLTGVITVNYSQLRCLLECPAADSDEVLLNDPRTTAAVAKALAAQGAKLHRHERITRFAIVPRFDIVSGELTSTLKLRRQFIAAKYACQIDALYADSATTSSLQEVPEACAISS